MPKVKPETRKTRSTPYDRPEKKKGKQKKTADAQARDFDLKDAPERTQRAFGVADQVLLSQNEHKRMCDWPARSQDKVGHAFVVRKNDGTLEAYQAPAPISRVADVPQLAAELDKPPAVRPLENIEEVYMYGQRRFRAQTPETQTPMYGRRLQHTTIDGVEGELVLMSPEPVGAKGVFWGSEKSIPIVREPQSGDSPETLARLAELKADMVSPEKKVVHLTVDNPSVPVRSGLPRHTDQNTTMLRYSKDSDEDIFVPREDIGDSDMWEGRTSRKGKPLNPPPVGSATNAAAQFLFVHADDLTPEAQAYFKEVVNAPLGFGIKSNKRFEWLHLAAYSNHPLTTDPQYEGNLIAAPKSDNTKMLLQERVLKWFAANQPQTSTNTTHTEASRLLGSHIAQNIYFQIDVENNGIHIAMTQNLDPYIKWPIYNKPSDIAQVVLFAYMATAKKLEGPLPVKSAPGHAADRSQAGAATRIGGSGPMTLDDLTLLVYGTDPNLIKKKDGTPLDDALAVPMDTSDDAAGPATLTLDALTRHVSGHGVQTRQSKRNSEADGMEVDLSDLESLSSDDDFEAPAKAIVFSRGSRRGKAPATTAEYPAARRSQRLANK